MIFMRHIRPLNELFPHGHGFIGYPKGRNVERALEPSCPCILCIPIHIITININLKVEHVARQSLLALWAPSLAKFGEVDAVPVSEKYTKHRSNSVRVFSQHFDL